MGIDEGPTSGLSGGGDMASLGAALEGLVGVPFTMYGGPSRSLVVKDGKSLAE